MGGLGTRNAVHRLFPALLALLPHLDGTPGPKSEAAALVLPAAARPVVQGRPPPTAPPLPALREGDARGGAIVLAPPLDGMVFLGAGSFEAGSGIAEQLAAVELCRQEVLGKFCREDQFVHEGLPHRVTLPAFWIDRTEVTVGAYMRCVSAAECSPPGFAPGDPRHDKPTLPVTLVTWDDARRFCAYRGARLPTEAEWERAARGLVGRRFPWGMLPNPRLANHGALDMGATISARTGWAEVGVADTSDGFSGLAPVGSFPDGRAPDGIYDLAGNAAEWVSDLWEEGYAASPATAPSGPAGGVAHVVRGGSYRQPMAMLRGAARTRRLPSTREPDLGFRCARDDAGN